MYRGVREYNYAMEIILLYLVLLLGGYLSGMLVNFIVDGLYRRRRFFSPELEEELNQKGWLKFLAWPFGFDQRQRRFTFRVMVVNLIFLVLVPLLWLAPPARVTLWWGLPVLIYFAVVIVMDVEYRIVMHPVSIAGAILGAFVGIYTHGGNAEAIRITAVGGAAGFAVMFVLYKLGEVFMNFINRRRGGDEIDEVALGFGDVNMAGVVGLFIGWPPIILGLLFAVFVGGMVSILYVIGMVITRRFRAFAALPYAPFLALAALVMVFFPDQIALLLMR